MSIFTFAYLSGCYYSAYNGAIALIDNTGHSSLNVLPEARKSMANINSFIGGDSYQNLSNSKRSYEINNNKENLICRNDQKTGTVFPSGI